MGLERSLTAGEIVGEVLFVMKAHQLSTGVDRLNIVMMGMGEPLLNLPNVLKATRILVDPDGVGLTVRRITVSTAGIVPKIEELGREPIRPKLAISLNASNEEQRRELMPITRKWNIEALLESLRPLTLRSKECVTFEYVLLGGVNDQLEHADEVIALMRQIPELRPKVNLIVWNPGPDIAYSQPKPEDVAERICDIIRHAGDFQTGARVVASRVEVA